MSIVALIALILFVEWMTGAEGFSWFQLLYLLPFEAVIALVLVAAFLGWLTRALQKRIIGPVVKWLGKW